MKTKKCFLCNTKIKDTAIEVCARCQAKLINKKGKSPTEKSESVIVNPAQVDNDSSEGHLFG